MTNWLKRIQRLVAVNADPVLQAMNAVAMELQNNDGWVPVAVDGDYLNWDKKIGNQHVTPESLNAMAAAVNAEAANAAWPGIWLGAGHGDNPAFGWSKAARVVDGVINGVPRKIMELQVAYNETGNRVINIEKQYKRVTPAWSGHKDAAGNFVPDRLLHVGFTNRPCIEAIPPAVNANTAPGAGAETEPGSAAATEPEGTVPAAASAAGGQTAAPATNAEPGAGSGTGPFADQFCARIRALIGDAKNDGEAWQKLWQQIDVLNQAREQLVALKTLVCGIGAKLGVQPQPPAGPFPGPDMQQMMLSALDGLTTAANAAPGLRDELAALNTRFDSFVAEMAVRTGRVAAGDPRVLQTLAADRQAAINCWFAPAAGVRPGATPRADLRELPKNPLAATNTRLPSTPPASAINVEPQLDAAAVATNVKAYMDAHQGVPYQTAFNAVLAEMTQPAKKGK